MSSSTPNPNGHCPVVELNFKGVFLRNPFSYKLGKPLLYGIAAIANDRDYASFIFDAYGSDGIIPIYVDRDGQRIEGWFGSEIEEEEDSDDSCIDSSENEEEIENLRDVEMDFNDDEVIMNITKGDDFV
ncbi:unnamed protein product [Lactuca saligna]|uniref:Uncharacterized protein n=1 Tax=Lactuca saligna TaxID=75948 RepID=A0AA35YYJ2_LACSI|nr:unnamed protein product [Lactuca saligna]